MEAVGAISGILTVVSAVTKLAKSLNEVRDRYNNVALNTTLVASQLNSIRAALEAIADWRTTTQDRSRPSQQLDEDLAISLNCCAILITVIDAKLGEAGYTPGIKQKIRHLWLEDTLKEYLSNLEGQIRSLHILLTIFQCRTQTEQRQKLEEQESRTVFNQLRAETASLYVDSDAASIFSTTPSRDLDVDPILMKHPAYINAYGKNSIRRRPVPPQSPSDVGYKGEPRASYATQQEEKTLPEKPTSQGDFDETTKRLNDGDEKANAIDYDEKSSPFRDSSFRENARRRSSASKVPSKKAESSHSQRRAEDQAKTSSPDADHVMPQLSLDFGSGEQDLGLMITKSGLSRAGSDHVSRDDQTNDSRARSDLTKDDLNSVDPPSYKEHQAVLPLVDSPEQITQSPADDMQNDKAQRARPLSSDSDLYGISIRAPSIKGDMKQAPQDEKSPDIREKRPFDQSVTEEKVSDPFNDPAECSQDEAAVKSQFIASLSGPFQWHLDDLHGIPPDISLPAQIRQSSSDIGPPPLRVAPPPPIRDAPQIPQLSLNPAPSDADDVESRSEDTPLPTPSESVTSLDYGHRRSTSSNDVSSLASYSRTWATLSPDTIASPAFDPPTSPREEAQMKLQELQRQLAEAKAKGDGKGAQQFLEKSIQIIHETYLLNGTSRPPTTWPPMPKASNRASLLRLPSLTQLASRGKKPQILALFNAVRSDDVPTIKDYLGQGVSINVRSDDYETPLTQAAVHGKLRSLEILKQYGADEFAVNAKGQTALHTAITHKQMYAVQWLLEAYPGDKGTSAPSKSWRLSRSPSSLAIRITKTLLEASDKEGCRPLHVAASLNGTALTEVLIAAGAKIEARNNLGGTPLHSAICRSSLDAARVLLARSARVDEVDANGWSPLHWTAKLGLIEATNILMEAGAQPLHSGSGDLPIHVAIRHGQQAAVENLMFHGTDVEAKTSKGDTLLLVATISNQMKIAEYLLRHSANANPFSRFVPSKIKFDRTILTKEPSDRTQPALTTPLHFACFAGWYEMSALLLDHQALINVPNTAGKPPLILAAEADDTNLVYLLIARGAKLNAAIPSSLHTAAHIASLKGNLETLQKLYQSNADIYSRASDGHSPEGLCYRCNDPVKQAAVRQWFMEIRNLRILKSRQATRQSHQQNTTASLSVQNSSVNSPPPQNDLALIQQLSPPDQYFDPQHDSFPEAPPPYVAGPSVPARFANRPGVYRPPGST